MFDANFDFDADFSEAANEPAQWVYTTAPLLDRKTLKEQRRACRGDGRGTGSRHQSQNASNQNNDGGRSNASRGARGLERRRRNAAEHVRHKNEPKDPNITWLPAESEEGNIEYKLRLKDPGAARLEQLITQMKYRIAEGQGECFYYVGVEDGGYPRGLSDDDLRLSLNNLNYMASALKATATIAHLFQGAMGRSCALVQVKRNCVEDVHYLEMRVAVGGSVGTGKSSLVAVLTHGADGEPLLDDGRGRARTAVFRHKHEIQSGHTSSISQSMLGYDSSGKVLNYLGVSSLTATEISAAAQKTGVNRTAREHLAAALALDIPVFAVVTKTDQADNELLAATLLEVRLLLATAADTATTARVADGGLAGHTTDGTTDAELPPGADVDGGMFATDDDVARSSHRKAQAQTTRLDKRAPVVDTLEKAAAVAQLMCILQQHHHPLLCRSYMVPCFLTSSTTGMGIPLLHRFLRGLQQAARRKQPVDISRRRRLFESYNGRVAPGVPDPPAYSWPRPPHAPTPCTPPPRSASQHSSHSSASHSSNSRHLETANTGPAAPVPPAHASSSPAEANIQPSRPSSASPQDECSSLGSPLGSVQRRAGQGPPVRAPPEVMHAPDPISSLALQASQHLHSSGVTELAHFQIDHMFEVTCVGTVFSGTVVSGSIELGSVLWWGPHDSTGEFSLVTVKGIHRSRVPVSKVAAGQCATISIDQQVSRAPSGITLVRQVGGLGNCGAAGDMLGGGHWERPSALQVGRRLSEPGSHQQASSPGAKEAAVSGTFTPSDANVGDMPSGVATQKSFGQVVVSSSAFRVGSSHSQGCSAASSPQVGSPAASSPLACEHAAALACHPLSGAQNMDSSQAADADASRALGQSSTMRSCAPPAGPATASGRGSQCSDPVQIPSRGDARDAQKQRQEQPHAEAAQEHRLAASFSDVLELTGEMGRPGGGGPLESSKPPAGLPPGVAGFLDNCGSTHQAATPGDGAVSAGGAAGPLQLQGDAHVGLSLAPTEDSVATAAHHQGSPELWETAKFSPAQGSRCRSGSSAAAGIGAGYTGGACSVQYQKRPLLDLPQEPTVSSCDVSASAGLHTRAASSSPAEAETGGFTGAVNSPTLPASLSPMHGQQPLSGEARRRLSESLPQQVHMSASPDAFGELSWHHVGLHLAGLATGEADTAAAAKGRKGTVMLDNRVEPHAVLEACAYMILTNGQWPPRGLLSGRWPPEEEDPISPVQGQRPKDMPAEYACASSKRRQQASDAEARPRLSRRPKYRHIIHCGSVRQEVEIDSIQEIPIDLKKERFEVDGVNLSAASAAAAVLVGDDGVDDEGNEMMEDELIGAVVDVTFRFRKPEWLIPGLRFVLRDQNGGVSAAGVIRPATIE